MNGFVMNVITNEVFNMKKPTLTRNQEQLIFWMCSMIAISGIISMLLDLQYSLMASVIGLILLIPVIIKNRANIHVNNKTTS